MFAFERINTVGVEKKMCQFIRASAALVVAVGVTTLGLAADSTIAPSCSSPAQLIGQPEEGSRWYEILFRDGVQVNAEIERLAARFNIAPKFKQEAARGFDAKLTPAIVEAMRCVSSVRLIEYADVITPGASEMKFVRLNENVNAQTGDFVQVRVLVGVDGRPREVLLLKSSGNPTLDEAAVQEAKRKWKFVPGTDDGKPVEMWITVPIAYRINH